MSTRSRAGAHAGRVGEPPGSGPAPSAEHVHLLHHERLMALAHLLVIPIALVAVLVRVDAAPPTMPWLVGVLAATIVYATLYHLVLPRWWVSRRKVLAGLLVDAVIVTEVVRLTGYYTSLLVFLYYLIIVAAALTLGRRALVGICAAVCGLFVAVLPFDPLFNPAPGTHLAQVGLFLASVGLVGLVAAAGGAQIRRAERRLFASLQAQRDIAEENARLSADLAEQLAASRALAASLERQREETRRLADMVIRVQEEERQRVARELHDEANQTLAALMTTVDAVDAADQQPPEQRRAGLARLRLLAQSTLADLQRIATELRPPALDEFGLLPALTRHVRDRTTGSGLRADVDIEGRRRRLVAAVEVALYRIAQEALANVQKHSHATTVHLRLRFLPQMVRLDVSDDGVGFDPGAPAAGERDRLGIAGMRERASIVGGTVEVTTRPGGGTRVSALIPTPEARPAPASGRGRAA